MQIGPPCKLLIPELIKRRYASEIYIDVAEKCANANSLTCAIFPFDGGKKEPAEFNLGRGFNKGKGDKT